MKIIPAKLKCFLLGHQTKATGRAGRMLSEWKCQRCGGLFVKHIHDPGVIVPADEGSDMIFRRFEKRPGGAS